MAIDKIKLTSESASDTQSKINANFEELDLDRATKENVFRYSTMPTASASNVGAIVQFIGATGTYTNGYYYKCILDNATYSWVQVDVQPHQALPTKTSDLTNDGDGDSPFATESYVETNGGKIDSISVNGTTQTIDESKNVDITVPVNASDVGALPNSTKYGASLTLSINSTTYVVTAQLKDQDGNNLGTAQTIDLPLESVVVNGSYDSATKKVILTLQNGSTIEFSVADLVSGLQTEITSSNKLDADLVDDSTSTNQFVTASDKSSWNSKQDAMSTLTFTDSDAGWGSLTSGYYTLTIVSAKVPIACFNSSGVQIMCELKYDGTNIYVKTDTKFSGKVIAI